MSFRLPADVRRGLFFTAGGLLSIVALRADGLPIQNGLVRKSCGACHAVDSQQRMSRISYVRKTPEGWEETIQRMARLHGFDAAPADARNIEQYLSAKHGLTASELEPVAYSLDGDDVQEQVPNEAVKNACTTCHTYGKIAGQRRTREEWLGLKDLLLALFPSLVYQHRFEDWVGLCDQALPWLADRFPLETPEWQREKDLPAPGDGRWLLTGHQPGKGDYVGVLAMKAGPDGVVQAESTRRFTDGSDVTVQGTGRWISSFAWRGSGHGAGNDRMREIFHLSADGTTQRGRWFPYPHSELGSKELRYRIAAAPQIVGVMPGQIRRGQSLVLRVYGANLDASLNAGALKFGEGVTVEKVDEATADLVSVRVRAAPDAKAGSRDVQVGAARKPAALAIYDKVDYLRVFPDKSMARLGGVTAVKRFIQFEAHAFSNGADGISGTADDLDLGLVKASWTLGESFTSYGEQDTKYVGSIDQNGLFTPAQEGPNPQRPRSTNNAGDVWVNASYSAEGVAVPLKARAYLLVSVPTYRELITP
jgi:quinohemoprotein amine dehydrogenase